MSSNIDLAPEAAVNEVPPAAEPSSYVEFVEMVNRHLAAHSTEPPAAEVVEAADESKQEDSTFVRIESAARKLRWESVVAASTRFDPNQAVCPPLDEGTNHVLLSVRRLSTGVPVFMSSGMQSVLQMLQFQNIPFDLSPLDITTICSEKFPFNSGGIKFEYEGHVCHVVALGPYNSLYAICDETEVAVRFEKAVFEYERAQSKRQVWFYDGGAWRQDSVLREQLRSMTWDTLYETEDFKRQLQFEVEYFFSEDGAILYKNLGVPHKRGMLFCGDPGTGKTHTARILAGTLNVSYLHVMNLDSREGHNHSLKAIFGKAAEIAPCIVLFEDLDTIVTPETRTTFLNLLDGFEPSKGVLTIGTTNYPEKLDQAVTSRPSRFDTKIVFPLPSEEVRLAYLLDKVGKLVEGEIDEEAREACREIAKKTNKLTCAYLQELVLTCAFIQVRESCSLAEALNQAFAHTRQQLDLGDGVKLMREMQKGSEDRLGFTNR